MSRFLYFVQMLIIQVPMIWRMTGHKKYFFRHLWVDNIKSEKKLRKLLKPIDKIVFSLKEEAGG